MTDKINFNTEGKEKEDQLDEQGADMEKARGAEWLAREMQDELEKVKQGMKCAVHFHEGGGEGSMTCKCLRRENKKNE